MASANAIQKDMAEESPLLPKVLGRFKIVKRLGEGGMCSVYEGIDAQLGRHVALKVLRPSLAAASEFRERFRREAVAMAQITHPHVLQVYELGEHDNQPFFAMELVDGGDCLQRLEVGHPLRIELVSGWVAQAAEGLGAAAVRGVVHRDVKPANLMLHQGHVKVSDFGIAREVQAASLTRTGVVLGSPPYMAPEQAMGATVDLRSDLYALGASFYHLLTGQPIFNGEPVAVMRAQVDSPMPDPLRLRADLPVGLVDLLRKMLAKRPEERFQRYEDLIAALGPFLTVAAGARAGALVFTEGTLAGRRVDLPDQGEFVVGRQADCNLVLDSQSASRRHALFVSDSSGLQVRDLGSRNGILVNGVRVHASRLKVGDRVKVGTETFAVAASENSAHTPTSRTSPRLDLLQKLARTAARSPAAEFWPALGDLVRPPLLGVTRLVVLYFEGGRSRVLAHEARNDEDRSTPPLPAAIGWVRQAGEPLVVSDAKTDPRFRSERPQVGAVLCAALRTPAGVQGVLYADATEARELGPDERACFEVIANLCALVMARP
jgi:GAF domain-containing protein